MLGRIALALLAVVAACVLAAQLLGPAHDGSPADFERTFLAACGRSGAVEADCDCALSAWSAAMGDEQRAELDRRLADGGELPAPLDAELPAAIAEC